MPRFALLIHDSPRGLHYDLLLESGNVLKTWALPQPPAPGVELECQPLADHRLLYLDYEGPISGGRGTVTRWDCGTFSVEIWTEDKIIARLSGERIAGQLALERMLEQIDRWRLRFSL